MWYMDTVLTSPCSLLNAILAIQCYAQGVRNVRVRRTKCPDCEHAQGQGSNNNDVPADEEEQEALLVGDENEAGPSEQGAAAAYRDEPEGETAA